MTAVTIGTVRRGGILDEDTRTELIALLPRLRRFALGLTGSVADGDDLVQSTYERAVRSIDGWSVGSRLDSWMFRIARNLHLNNLRAGRVRRRHLEAVGAEDEAGFDGLRYAESRLLLAQVRQFIMRLPEEQRAVLLLVAVEGFSYRQVADTLGLPVGTVTSRIGRARFALKAYLDGPRSGDTGTIPEGGDCEAL